MIQLMASNMDNFNNQFFCCLEGHLPANMVNFFKLPITNDIFWIIYVLPK